VGRPGNGRDRIHPLKFIEGVREHERQMRKFFLEARQGLDKFEGEVCECKEWLGCVGVWQARYVMLLQPHH
jgi:hypothetical protein